MTSRVAIPALKMTVAQLIIVMSLKYIDQKIKAFDEMVGPTTSNNNSV